MKLCLLTFTRNNFEQAMSKVRRYYNFFDRFVIIDSSNVPPPDSGFGGVVVFRAPALGYADPLHQFGVRRAVELGCDWVVKLDVDEELSEDLLRDLRGILEGSSCDAYLVAFYVYDPILNRVVYDGEKPNIFRPNKAYFNGVIHEGEAQINGKTCKLNPTKYHIKHTHETPLHKDHERLKRYAEIESYERPLTLRTYILRSLAHEPRLLPLLSRFPLPATILLSPSLFAVLEQLRRYIRRLIRHRNISEENLILTSWDLYRKFIYNYMRSLSSREIVTRIRIAMDMYHVGGVTKYLCLDKDDVVERLVKIAEHIKNFGGVEFFGILMKLRYVTGGCDYVDKLEKILGVV